MGCGDSKEAPERRGEQYRNDHLLIGVLYSGGGLRAYASSAVFTLALMNTEGLWQDVDELHGVSGGSWFCYAYQVGGLKGMSKAMSIDQLLDRLEEFRVITELTAEEKARIRVATNEVLRKVKGAGEIGALATDVANIAADTFSTILGTVKRASSPTKAWDSENGAAPPHDDVILSLAPLLMDCFGTGLIAAAEKDPIPAYAKMIEPKVGLMPGGIPPPAYGECPELSHPHRVFYTAIADSTSGGKRYAWISFQLHTYDIKIQRPSQCHFPFAKGSVDAPKASIPSSLIPAVCGSAFAADWRAVAREKLHRNIEWLGQWTTGPVVRNSTFHMNLYAPTTSDFPITPLVPEGQQHRQNFRANIRDAGIENNLPLVPSNQLDVAYAIDSTADGQLGDCLREAIKHHGLPAYREGYRGRDGRWAIYVREPFPCIMGPRVIVYFMGLTDNQTMEQTDKNKRRAQLKDLFEFVCKELPKVRELVRQFLPQTTV